MNEWEDSVIVIVDDNGPIGINDKVRRQAWYFRACRAMGIEPEVHVPV